MVTVGLRRTMRLVGGACVFSISACSEGTGLRSPACDTTPLSLAAGEVRTPLTAPCVYIAADSAGGEYVLVPFNGNTSYATVQTLSFTSSGASPVTTPLPDRAALTSYSSFDNSLDRSFDGALRQSERKVLTPLIPAARAWYNGLATRASSGNALFSPSFAAMSTPWVVGDTVAFNVKTGPTAADACQTPDIRTGRVAAISNTAIVVADTGNPSGGFTDANYATIAAQFDSVYAMDTGAFGTPSDIDGNGKVILFFTRAVNELTPPNSGGIVGGFFYARDLFPRQDSPQLGAGSGCPTSNVAEMFYLLVPDPNGVVNGNIRPLSYVLQVTPATTAHEFQHLINAARRLYVNQAASDFEVVWLNEGLSHIAEELLFYQQSAGLTPRMDIDSTRFRTVQQNANAYNYDEAANFGRFKSYLTRPSTSSPYAPDDSLWTRGATWSFLRYAADHRGTGDADTWYRLVNSTTTGLGTLGGVFGADLTSLFRDWAIAHAADDVPNVPSEWQHPSWHFKSMYTYIYSHSSTPNLGYPLATLSLSDGAPVAVSLNGGGAAYVRFRVSPNTVANMHWTGASNDVVMTLVRLQ